MGLQCVRVVRSLLLDPNQLGASADGIALLDLGTVRACASELEQAAPKLTAAFLALLPVDTPFWQRMPEQLPSQSRKRKRSMAEVRQATDSSIRGCLVPAIS